VLKGILFCQLSLMRLALFDQSSTLTGPSGIIDGGFTKRCLGKRNVAELQRVAGRCLKRATFPSLGQSSSRYISFLDLRGSAKGFVVSLPG
jgi:hypothetical protein